MSIDVQDINLKLVNYYSLENEGYNRCPGTIDNLKRGASNLFQKRFRNKSTGETLYFINVYEFDFLKYQEAGQYPKDMPVLKYQAEARFYRGKQEFDVELLFLQNTSIEEMENFFKEIYTVMRCEPDHHNQ